MLVEYFLSVFTTEHKHELTIETSRIFNNISKKYAEGHISDAITDVFTLLRESKGVSINRSRLQLLLCSLYANLGLLQETICQLDLAEEDIDFDEEFRHVLDLEGLFVKVEVYLKLEKYESSTLLLQEILFSLRALKSGKLLDFFSMIYSCMHGENVLRTGLLDNGLKELKTALENNNSLLHPSTRFEVICKARIINNMGIAYTLKGQLELAMEFHKQNLILYTEISHKQKLASTMNNIGLIYDHQGKLDQALHNYERSLEIFKKIGNKQVTLSSYTNIGIIYFQKGFLDKSEEFHEKALDLERKLGNEVSIGLSLSSLGDIYRAKGELFKAKEFFLESLEKYKSVGSSLYLASAYFHLVEVYLELDLISEAENMLKILNLIASDKESQTNKFILSADQYARAIVLKKSPRSRNKIKAQTIFMEIVDNPIINFELTSKAMVHLIETLIVELNQYGEPEVLNELKTRISTLHQIAKDNQSFHLLVHSYLLQARMVLTEGDLVKAEDFITQAILIAEEYGLTSLHQKALNEKEKILFETDKWQELIKKNATFIEMLLASEMEDYVKALKKYAHK